VFDGREPEAVFDYCDANGRLVFHKLRFPGKKFHIRRPDGTRWVNNLDGIHTKPLYNLPAVIVAHDVLIAEGEKDADHLTELLGGLHEDWEVAATTNFDGAGKWRDHYSPHFTGKQVVIFADNDAIGAKHAQMVARSVSPYGCVKVVDFPELAEHGDVSDFIALHGDQAKELLIKRVKDASVWSDDTGGRSSASPEIIVTAWGAPKALLANAITLLRTDPQWQGVLAYNEFSLYAVTKKPVRRSRRRTRDCGASAWCVRAKVPGVSLAHPSISDHLQRGDRR
jgi:hypothetical protein